MDRHKELEKIIGRLTIIQSLYQPDFPGFDLIEKARNFIAALKLIESVKMDNLVGVQQKEKWLGVK